MTLEEQGNFLFKYRGQFPILLFLSSIPFIKFTFFNNYNEIFIFSSIFFFTSGYLIRFYTIATTPKNTSGRNTKKQIADLIPLLNKGDIIIDGGNSNFKQSVKMGSMLEEYDIGFMDCGTSGGVWGLDNGYCLMVGASHEVAKAVEPALKALAPTPQTGWLHVGPVGSGHFTKMIHNGIEYGMMESFAEGLELLKGRKEYDIDIGKVTELWRHGSVVRSWLLDLTAEALKGDPELDEIAPFVADSGEGRWTAVEAIEQGIPAPVLTQALQVRFRSQEKSKGYGYKILSIMRNAFGGHVMKKKG